MPRPNRGRTLDHERWVATRLKTEREARGWSLDKVAKAMAEVGCPMPVSAIHKIEKSDPPRKISLNEFLAFAEVFGIPTNELMQPPEVADDDEAKKLVSQLQEAETAVRDPLVIYVDLRNRLREKHPKVSDELFPDWPILRLPSSSGEWITINLDRNES